MRGASQILNLMENDENHAQPSVDRHIWLLRPDIDVLHLDLYR